MRLEGPACHGIVRSGEILKNVRLRPASPLGVPRILGGPPVSKRPGGVQRGRMAGVAAGDMGGGPPPGRGRPYSPPPPRVPPLPPPPAPSSPPLAPPPPPGLWS